MIFASEDIGNADPQALPLAVAAMQACEFVGLPECQLTLAQAVTYLACAPKSNAATVALSEASRDVREGRLLPVPVICATATTNRPNASATAKAINIRTMRPMRSPPRIIWASTANITVRSIEVWSGN